MKFAYESLLYLYENGKFANKTDTQSVVGCRYVELSEQILIPILNPMLQSFSINKMMSIYLWCSQFQQTNTFILS